MVEDDIISGTAGMAACEVEGVLSASSELIQAPTVGRPARGDGSALKGGRDKRALAFHIALVVDHGYHIPTIVADVRRRVRQRIAEATGLETARIDLDVVDIEVPEKGAEASAAQAHQG